MPKSSKESKVQIPAVATDIPTMDTRISDVSIDYCSLYFLNRISVLKHMKCDSITSLFYNPNRTGLKVFSICRSRGTWNRSLYIYLSYTYMPRNNDDVEPSRQIALNTSWFTFIIWLKRFRLHAKSDSFIMVGF